MKITLTKKPFKGKPVGSEVEMTDKQARLLTKMGRAQYMTRDMVATPPSFRPAAAAAQTNAAAPALTTDELDAAGAAWDEKIHAASRLKNSDGTWRKRPGARPPEPEPQP